MDPNEVVNGTTNGQERESTEQSAAGVTLHEHSNDNLLKIDTHDKFSTVGSIKKLILKTLAVNPSDEPPKPLLQGLLRINKNPKNPVLFMAFESEGNRDAASAFLQTISFRGKQWVEVPVTQRDLNLTHKGGGATKRPREEGCAGDGASKLTQYEQYTLEEQLEKKKVHCLGVMKSIVLSRVYGWDAYAKRFLGVIPSPVSVGYRNHVNLSFGRDEHGQPALGFQKGSLVEGTATIEPATLEEKSVVTMHPLAKVVASAVMKVCTEFAAAEKGGLDVFNKVKAEGFWRKLQVRHNVRGEVMLDVEVDADSAASGVTQRVKERLVEMFTDPSMKAALEQAAGAPTGGVVSLQVHKHTGISSLPEDAEREVLLGTPTLTEYLSGLAYELSPTAFFQVNTPGMEKMLEKVHEVAELTPSTTLLDLCSGTGTIGLTLAKYVKRVIGIELVAPAVENAKRNAERNQISNAAFHCGRVEHLLPTVINALSAEDKKDIVAILDPPRAGVNGTVLKWIRGTETIRRVVYISCEQKALERDCPGLTKPATKAYRGEPFEVSAGFAVDLFPHTHHVEMVAVLSRCDAAPEPAEPVTEVI